MSDQPIPSPAAVIDRARRLYIVAALCGIDDAVGFAHSFDTGAAHFKVDIQQGDDAIVSVSAAGTVFCGLCSEVAEEESPTGLSKIPPALKNVHDEQRPDWQRTTFCLWSAGAAAKDTWNWLTGKPEVGPLSPFGIAKWLTLPAPQTAEDIAEYASETPNRKKLIQTFLETEMKDYPGLKKLISKAPPDRRLAVDRRMWAVYMPEFYRSQMK